MGTTTIVFAVYGAILSTLVLFWQVHLFLIRRAGRIKVRVLDNMIGLNDVGSEGPFIVFTAANDGEKPVTLNKLIVTVKGASAFAADCYITDTLPGGSVSAVGFRLRLPAST